LAGFPEESETKLLRCYPVKKCAIVHICEGLALFLINTKNMQPRIAIVEDDALTRLTLASALRSQGMTVVIETASGSQAVKEYDLARPHVALLDLHLGNGPTGIDVALALRAKSPNIGIVFLSSFEDPRLLNPSLPALPFRSVYLTKNQISDIGVLKDALAQSVSKAPIGPGKNRTTETLLGNLSDVQLETLRLMAQGLSNAEIARRRSVTEKAVELSIARLSKSLGIHKDSTRNQRVHIANVYFRAIGQIKSDSD